MNSSIRVRGSAIMALELCSCRGLFSVVDACLDAFGISGGGVEPGAFTRYQSAEVPVAAFVGSYCRE